MKIAIVGTVAAALVAAVPAAAFTPADPLFTRQWYLTEDHAFDAWPTPPGVLAPVKVGIVDSGIDGSLPAFAGQIAAARSFVGGDPLVDTEGHGTLVAGEIAAKLDTVGIVGLAYSAQLVVAKVVRADGSIPIQAEADAIRWVADQGAKVINLSLGGARDPGHPGRDYYSQAEADAVAYAYSKGAVIVAAVGNSDEAYATPWPYASYPAALPHVIGVSALTRTGGVPDFSDRDPIFNDLAAPGSDIFSTFPLALTKLRPTCQLQGTTACAGNEYRHAEGTSFAAPQVAAAAAVLLAVRPDLTNNQVGTLLERSADDVNAATGCRQCPLGRDRFSGWGSLDVAKAVEVLLAGGPLPAPDRYETNDEAGSRAYTLWGKTRTITATLDFYDDPVDVYRVSLGKGERLVARVNAGWTGANVGLELWQPGTQRIEETAANTHFRVAQSVAPGAVQRLVYRATEHGWFYVEAKVDSPGSGPYTLSLIKKPPPKPRKKPLKPAPPPIPTP
ncbi:MAG TPA: S8 family serine peptidase [Gaiellaceae bacterium]|nr:S8 family serine peptidase [Gaiellaceae bacterium]